MLNPFVDDLQSRAVDAQSSGPWFMEGEIMILVAAGLALVLAASFALAAKE